MSISNLTRALQATKIGLYVFPCNPVSKKPIVEDGLKRATLDQDEIKAYWAKNPKAQVGVHAGRSGLVILDIDVEKDEDGATLKSGWDAIDDAWVDLPDTHSVETPRGGTHKYYLAPEGKILNGQSDYRHMKAIDRRGGESYAILYGSVPESRAWFQPAPEWLCDEAQVRTADIYEGTVKEWYESLQPGTPNVLVRAAIERAQALGEDFSHNQMAERQFEAVRLGAEGNPGVPELLAVLEDLTLSRTGSHNRTPDEYAHEFAEALASGITKHGQSIALIRDLPAYSLDLIPVQVTDRLVTGDPGTRETFSELLSQLLRYEDDDYRVLSVLWNAPTVRDLSREWGLEFVYKRILDSRRKPGDQPARLATPAVQVPDEALLTPEEVEVVKAHPTFIDAYVAAATAAKKFPNPTYDTTAAWELLSMTLGGCGRIPKGKAIGLNLWFLVLGDSGTGKSSSDKFLKDCLDSILQGGETYYNLGANSSPEGLHEALLSRDGMPSMIHHDEASDFFDNLKKKDWMASLKDLLSKWYEGYVDPMQKVRLKENKGKSAKTSLGLYMLATPDRLLSLVDLSMFETGFLARMNWAWAPPNPDEGAKYKATLTEITHVGMDPHVYPLVTDLVELREEYPIPVSLSASPEALKRLVKAHRDMDGIAQGRDRYVATEPAVTRLGRETVWKCAGLLAMYRGSTTINLVDALTAIHYVQDWFNTLFRVVNAAGEGDFNRDVNDIEEYVAAHPNGVTLPSLYNRFRTMITKSVRDLDDRIQFLVASGRVRRDAQDGTVRYYAND